jgi:Circadian oscillating protein COP23
MKNLLAIFFTGILSVNAIAIAPATAQTQTQPEGKFYCGQSYDPSSKTDIPTTLMSSPNRETPLAVIRWKSEYFGKKFTPQQRCEIVSPKFQAAYTSGRLVYLVTGEHQKNQEQIVCAVESENERCEDDSNMVFTLKPYADGKTVLQALLENIEGFGGGADSTVIYQNSKLQRYVVKLSDAISSRK